MYEKAVMIQVLRNQLTDMEAVRGYAIAQKDQARHAEYVLRIQQTKALLSAIEDTYELETTEVLLPKRGEGSSPPSAPD